MNAPMNKYARGRFYTTGEWDEGASGVAHVEDEPEESLDKF